ncbi:glycosyl transferase family 2 [Limosilactobacillus fermentum]|uniref:glycosyl transferase family 2 n=1 Tax=Limosilactobacillus fermentum TaxID=1613 RepID=UPI0021BE979C|nr:glycosyl transferase family 2 [Limosilactobacillus fermentum]
MRAKFPFLHNILDTLPNLRDSDFETMILTPQKAIQMQYEWHLNGSVFVVIWGKLIKKECLDGFWFPEGMMYEDEAATHRMFMRTPKIVFVNKEYYSYRIRPGSVSREEIDDKNLQDLFQSYQIKIADLVSVGISPEPTRARYLPIIRYRLERSIDQGPQFPGYRECQEKLRLADLNQ